MKNISNVRNRRIGVALVIALLMTLPTQVSGGQALADDQRTGKTLNIEPTELAVFLDPIFETEMEKEHIPGAVFVLVKDGKVVLARGYGLANVEKKIPVDPAKTIFRIGSISKVFAAMSVVQLADRKKISLNDDVNRYLSRFKIEEKYGEPVRFQHLLTHTAGFDQIGTGRQASNPEQRRSIGEFLDGQLIRIRPPGQISCYDTYGITLAGYLVERISNLTYSEYLKKNIFEPLGMTRSNLEVTENLKSDLALGYGYSNGEYVPQRYEYYVTTPASSIDSTALDMARFMIAVLGNGSVGKGRLFSLSMASRIKQQQFTNHNKFPGFAYGFWENYRNEQRAIYHGGAMLGYLSHLYFLPEHKLGFFIAYNRDVEAGGGPANLRDIITQKLMDRWFPIVKSGDVLTAPAIKLDTSRFAGSYTNNLYCHTCPDGQGWGWSVFPVRSAGEGVIEMWGSRWLAVDRLLFQREGSKSQLAFKEDRNGQITHIFYNNEAFDILGEHLIEEVFGPDWKKQSVEPLTARVYRDSGQNEKAARAYESIGLRQPDNGRLFFYAGYCWLNAGEEEKALAALERARELKQWPRDTAYLTAAAYAASGDKDRAFEWLEQAIKLGFSSKRALQSDTKWWGEVRDDPRFQELVRRLNSQ